MIENSVKAELPFISNIMVIGDRRKFLSALISMQVCKIVLNIQMIHISTGLLFLWSF